LEPLSLSGWICNQQKRGLALNADNFTAETMSKAAKMKTLRKNLVDNETSVKDLGKFNLDDFDAHKDASVLWCH
jgi:hypothetical protein